jgi:hypothetical protein
MWQADAGNTVTSPFLWAAVDLNNKVEENLKWR